MNVTSELQKRVVTGCLGAMAVVLAVVFGGWILIFILTTALSLAMVHEYACMSFSLPDRTEKRYALLCLAWLFAVLSLLMGRADFELLLAGFFLLFFYYLLIARRHDDEVVPAHFRELLAAFFGLVYLVFIPQYLPRIHGLPNGIHWTIVFMLIVWTGDTGAYFAGKKYGRRKLYPKISPKKTVEGALGGLACGLICVLLYKLILFRAMSWAFVLVGPVVVGAFAQVGDFCESFLKRACDKKDSGSLLPGHGGFMDRFDGIVFGLPVMYACIRVLS